MKDEFNKIIDVIKVNKKINEIILFQEMANEFNKKAKCVYIEPIHHNLVEFSCKTTSQSIETCELGDLLILTYDLAKHELRVCVMQVKYHHRQYKCFLNLQSVNLLQWDLLRYKPDVTDKSKMKFPTNILNFRDDYKSITAYGVFYHDNINKDIDFLYTIPEFLKPARAPKLPMKSPCRAFHFRCGHKPPMGSPNLLCYDNPPGKDEETCTCSMDNFESQLLSCKIGAPINDKGIRKWILGLLLGMRSNDTSGVIDEILSAYGYNINARESREYSSEYDNLFPATFIIISDSDKYKVSML